MEEKVETEGVPPASEAAGISFAENVKAEESPPTLKRLGRTFSISSISLTRENGAPLISLPHPHFDPDAHELARAEAASWAQMTPLIAATLGPLAVLLGIPALTQPWQGLLLDPPVLPSGVSNYMALPYPTVNTVLAAFTFACEVLGNAFLILRFSNYHTKVTTWLSFTFWLAKIIFGLANYIQFGITHRETDQIIYLQGYWVGVCSMAITVIIILFLTFNLAFLHQQSVAGMAYIDEKEFMFQTLMFFFYIGLVALIFSKTEGTTYVDALYFEVVTTLTIGFGDITPKTTAFKVLTFPFTVVGITLLALTVTSIVRLLADRSRRRKISMKKQLKKKERRRINEQKNQQREEHKDEEPTITYQIKRSLTLQDSLHKIRDDSWKHERAHNLRGMITGLLVFFSFWFLGAMIFNFVEPWGYGNSLYFCYIFFLTIGFGDYSPTSEAGRPIFIVYALLAVPTMTVVGKCFVEDVLLIAVETVTSNFTAYTMQRMHRKRHQVYLEKEFEIRSLNSLVKDAKAQSLRKMGKKTTDNDSVHLPLHGITERLTQNLHHMHHHLQHLMAKKLGPDARHVIAAERARQEQARMAGDSLFPLPPRPVHHGHHNHHHEHHEHHRHHHTSSELIAEHLSEIGQFTGDELELLNEYRERYAAILGDLLVVKDTLVEFEKGLEQRVDDVALRQKLTEEISELEVGAQRRSSAESIGTSISSSSSSITSDEDDI